MKIRNIVLLGGDLRQYYMAKSLIKRGFAISYYGLLFPKELPEVRHCKDKEEVWEKLREKSTILVMPVPSTSDGVYVKSNSFSDDKVLLEEIPDHVEKEHCVFGGSFPVFFYRKMEKKGVRLVDFMKCDNVADKNAVSTAEGAIVEAKLLSDETIFGSESLVLGFGRCGIVLAQRLRALGSHVTIVARREEVRRAAQLSGYRVQGLPLTKQESEDWNFVFNTIPEPVLDARALHLLEPETVIIDIAAAPGGVDYDYAKKQEITAKLCLELPGKYAAKSVGEMLAEELYRELSL